MQNKFGSKLECFILKIFKNILAYPGSQLTNLTVAKLAGDLSSLKADIDS